ncbi:MAG: AMP-binding protein [Chloroflexota bacterium]
MSLNERLNALIIHAYDNAPAVKLILDEAGVSPSDIQSLADLPKIPVTTKDQLVQMQQADLPFGGWLAVPKESLKHIYVSPGPIFEVEGPDDEPDTGAFEAIGLGSSDLILNTFMYHLVSAGILLDAGAQAVGATVIPTGPGNTDYQVQIMMGLGATAYTGTPSFLKIILDKAAEMQIPRQAIPIKKALFSAEPYPPSLRNLFEQDYGMITANAYATAELGVVAYDRTGDAAMRIADSMIVEIVDPERGQPVPVGEVGHVVVTRFNNTYPLIRFGLGDLSAFVGEPDDEGYYRHIKGWMGRVGDAIKVRGMFLHPLQMKAALGQFSQISNMQAIVTRSDTRDHVELRVETTDAIGDQPDLSDAIKTAVSNACRLKVDTVTFVTAGSITADARPVVDERSWD